MKIGLVPLLYNEYNYGGVLQFFALQQVLRKLNNDIEIVFFHNDERISYQCLSKYQKIVLKLKIYIATILNKKKRKKLNSKLENRKNRIDLFKNKNYCKMVDENEIDIMNYDAFVCGSDQIWNPLWARRRSFLEFVPEDVNKIIYAASLGCESMSDEQKNNFKPRIERINHVSVREESAKRILDSFIKDKNIEVVLDPTLLILGDEWKTIASHTKYSNYIFTYFLGYYYDKIEYIQQFASKHNLSIINIPYASGEKIDDINFGDVMIDDADPADFIGLILGADYIFTDSFHACVFSFMFKKEFYVFERNGSKQMMGRITTLFNNFKLPNRIIPVGKINELPTIDYSEMDKRQKDHISKSMNFLTESLYG